MPKVSSCHHFIVLRAVVSMNIDLQASASTAGKAVQNLQPNTRFHAPKFTGRDD